MFKTKKEITKWLDEYEIIDYTINDDLSVDVDGCVDLSCNNLTEIPVQFNIVNGWFSCDNNKLTSLKDCPKEVSGDFWCYNNQLTSLVGSPKEVSGGFYCYNNQLTSLKHLPMIHGKLYCDKDLQETREYKIYEISKRLREMV